MSRIITKTEAYVKHGTFFQQPGLLWLAMGSGVREIEDEAAKYPSQYESLLVLKNGREVFLRPMRLEDGPLILDLFGKLSKRSVYMRFLRPLPALPEAVLHQLTYLDYETTFALAALVREGGGETLIAVSRYAFNQTDGRAELAVTVRDDWQHLGLGPAMLGRVVEIAKMHGIRRFGGMIEPANNSIRHVLADLGYRVHYTPRDGFFEAEIEAT